MPRLLTRMPAPLFPEMMLRAAVAVPPMVAEAPVTRMPLAVLPCRGPATPSRPM